MDMPTRYVATTKEEECQQTFVFAGTTTLDELFAHVAERGRGGGFPAIADRLFGKFRLSLSRDEFCEPAASERFDDRLQELRS
jgi:hypothetical protein